MEPPRRPIKRGLEESYQTHFETQDLGGLNALPNELILHIFSLMPPNNQIPSRAVNRRLLSLIPKNPALAQQVTTLAAKEGHLNLVKWGMQNNIPATVKTCAAAAEGGQLEILQYLHAQGTPWDETTCAAAAKANRPGILSYALGEGLKLTRAALEGAAEGGHKELLSAISEQDFPFNTFTGVAAARGGQIELLQELLETGIPFHPDMFLEAPPEHLPAIFKLAKAKGVPEDHDFYTHVLSNAVDQGNIAVIDQAIKNGVPPRKYLAYTTRVEVLEWARVNNIVAHDYNDIVTTAINRGHLPVAQWAYKNGGRWKEIPIFPLVLTGNLDLIKWIHATKPLPLLAIKSNAMAEQKHAIAAWAQSEMDKPIPEAKPKSWWEEEAERDPDWHRH